MKVRARFISNSSSSSFLIYGAHILNKNITKEDLEKVLDREIDDGFRLNRLVEEAAHNLGLEFIYGNGEYYIGKSWDSMGEDETKRQFKKSIETAVKKISPNLSCETYEDSWYDG